MPLVVKDSHGSQKIKLTHNRAAGISGRLDYLRLNYTRVIGLGHPIYATGSGIHTYELPLDAWGYENTVVWRITDAAERLQAVAEKDDVKRILSRYFGINTDETQLDDHDGDTAMEKWFIPD